MDKKLKCFSRRKFIGDAATIGTLGTIGLSAIVSSCSTRSKYAAPVFLDQAPDGPVLKAGLVGCGNRGTGAAFNFLDSGPNLEIVALGDVFQDRMDRCRNQLRSSRNIEIPDEKCFLGFDSYKKVIDSGIDVVLLCQPSHFRPESLRYAIQARKHVFAEKCIAVDPLGVRSVMASGKMAESAGLNIIVGTQRRHQRDYVKTFEMVKNGAIGDLVSGNCYWNQGAITAHTVYPQEGWSDMEAMIRNFFNWCWLNGDHILDQHVHNLDVILWFFQKYPIKAVGFGGRHRRPLGDQYDFFSVDFEFDDNRHIHGMCRQIDGCANNVSEIIFGTKGYTNCRNSIFDYNGNVVWEYQYPLGEDGQRLTRVSVSPYVQGHINLVTAIRSGNYINEIQYASESVMCAIMGRESAYTGKEITWDDMINSNMRLGPTEYKMGPVDVSSEPPIPGTAPA